MTKESAASSKQKRPNSKCAVHTAEAPNQKKKDRALAVFAFKWVEYVHDGKAKIPYTTFSRIRILKDLAMDDYLHDAIGSKRATVPRHCQPEFVVIPTRQLPHAGYSGYVYLGLFECNHTLLALKTYYEDWIDIPDKLMSHSPAKAWVDKLLRDGNEVYPPASANSDIVAGTVARSGKASDAYMEQSLHATVDELVTVGESIARVPPPARQVGTAMRQFPVPPHNSREYLMMQGKVGEEIESALGGKSGGGRRRNRDSMVNNAADEDEMDAESRHTAWFSPCYATAHTSARRISSQPGQRPDGMRLMMCALKRGANKSSASPPEISWNMVTLLSVQLDPDARNVDAYVRHRQVWTPAGGVSTFSKFVTDMVKQSNVGTGTGSDGADTSAGPPELLDWGKMPERFWSMGRDSQMESYCRAMAPALYSNKLMLWLSTYYRPGGLRHLSDTQLVALANLMVHAPLLPAFPDILFDWVGLLSGEPVWPTTRRALGFLLMEQLQALARSIERQSPRIPFDEMKLSAYVVKDIPALKPFVLSSFVLQDFDPTAPSKKALRKRHRREAALASAVRSPYTGTVLPGGPLPRGTGVGLSALARQVYGYVYDEDVKTGGEWCKLAADDMDCAVLKLMDDYLSMEPTESAEESIRCALEYHSTIVGDYYDAPAKEAAEDGGEGEEEEGDEDEADQQEDDSDINMLDDEAEEVEEISDVEQIAMYTTPDGRRKIYTSSMLSVYHGLVERLWFSGNTSCSLLYNPVASEANTQLACSHGMVLVDRGLVCADPIYPHKVGLTSASLAEYRLAKMFQDELFRAHPCLGKLRLLECGHPALGWNALWNEWWAPAHDGMGLTDDRSTVLVVIPTYDWKDFLAQRGMGRPSVHWQMLPHVPPDKFASVRTIVVWEAQTYGVAELLSIMQSINSFARDDYVSSLREIILVGAPWASRPVRNGFGAPFRVLCHRYGCYPSFSEEPDSSSDDEGDTAAEDDKKDRPLRTMAGLLFSHSVLHYREETADPKHASLPLPSASVLGSAKPSDKVLTALRACSSTSSPYYGVQADLESEELAPRILRGDGEIKMTVQTISKLIANVDGKGKGRAAVFYTGKFSPKACAQIVTAMSLSKLHMMPMSGSVSKGQLLYLADTGELVRVEQTYRALNDQQIDCTGTLRLMPVSTGRVKDADTVVLVTTVPVGGANPLASAVHDTQCCRIGSYAKVSSAGTELSSGERTRLLFTALHDVRDGLILPAAQYFGPPVKHAFIVAMPGTTWCELYNATRSIMYTYAILPWAETTQAPRPDIGRILKSRYKGQIIDSMFHYYMTAVTHGCLDRPVCSETSEGKYEYDPEMVNWLGMRALLDSGEKDSLFLRNIALGDHDEVVRNLVVEPTTGAIVDNSEVQDEEDSDDEDSRSRSKKQKKPSADKAKPRKGDAAAAAADSEEEDDDYKNGGDGGDSSSSSSSSDDDDSEEELDDFIVPDDDADAECKPKAKENAPEGESSPAKPRARKARFVEDDLSIDAEFFDKVVKQTGGGRARRRGVIPDDSDEEED